MQTDLDTIKTFPEDGHGYLVANSTNRSNDYDSSQKYNYELLNYENVCNKVIIIILRKFLIYKFFKIYFILGTKTFTI